MSEPYRYRCPECGCSNIFPSTATYTDHNWRCKECYATFDRREDKKKSPDRPEVEPSGDWDLTDAELIGLVRTRRD